RQSGEAALHGVLKLEDYMKGINGIPEDNVLRFILEEDSWIAVRPSGTEPKLKVYYSIRGDDKEKAGARLAALQKAIAGIIKA
ncbi:MAG: phospho-sugar mutase, partial [Clostridiales bacterium]|nr:phospho-sugar mutase [Clostridiales bacterium]